MNSLPAQNIWYLVTIHFVSSHLTPNILGLTEYHSYLNTTPEGYLSVPID
jgi:hypothetical protein